MISGIKSLKESQSIEEAKEFLKRVKEWSELSNEDLKKVILDDMDETLSSPEKMEEFKAGLKETYDKAMAAFEMLESLEETILKLDKDKSVKVLTVDMDDFIDNLK